jgi:hypothetical protein
MKNDDNNRVLSRRGARDLTAEEQIRVSGGAHTTHLTSTFREPLDFIPD